MAVPGDKKTCPAATPARLVESRRAFVGDAVRKGAVAAAAATAAAAAVGVSAGVGTAVAYDSAPSTSESGRSSELAASMMTTPATFQTRAYGQAEYTNSLTASRDTNISPKEAYDVIRERIPANQHGREGRALDVGAGAGLSTAVLYVERGYRTIDAVDWSGKAWSENVIEPLPSSVRWYESDDDQFLSTVASPKSYHVIVYNFAINPDKAYRVARRYLVEGGNSNSNGDGGLLLAPVNDRADYWYKQSYLLLNANGDVLWKSEPEVGAWSVQFQPDVTSDTCTGIWCGGYNGYHQKRQH